MPKIAGFSKAGRSSFNRILLDMNTQCDLLFPQGAMPVINRGEVFPNIGKIMNWARASSLPVVSSMECRRIGDVSRGLPPYCVDRSIGQRKAPITLLPRRIVMRNDNTLSLPPKPFHRFQQIILIKRSRDFLLNPRMDLLLHTVSANHMVVFGAVAERCVKSVVLGLLARQHRVGVVTDACGGWSISDVDMAIRRMAAKGAVLVTTDELISGAADMSTPPSISRMIAAEIPNSRVALQPEAGHSTYWEQPELFNRAVLDFINDQSK